MSQSFSEHEMSLIKKHIRDNAGVNLENFKTPFLVRRINARMMAKGVKEGSEYAQLLAEDPIEALTFYKSLSINVTQCYRDPAVWNIFATEIVPQIVSRAVSGQTIRIWSAGCATGQEPYSLAMMFHDAIDSKNLKFKIIATDMNKVAINIAKSGKYEAKSLKNIPAILFPKYIHKLDDNLFQIREDLQKSIQFEVDDILSQNIDSLDVIMCRNLLIYYGKEAQEMLFKKFFSALNHNGYLILGMDETMIGTEGTKLFRATNPRQRIYQKISGET